MQLVKGSREAREYMAEIRAMRGRKKKHSTRKHTAKRINGMGLMDTYNKYKEHQFVKPLVRHAKKYAHQGVKYLSDRAHEFIGNGLHRSHSRRSHSRRSHSRHGMGLHRSHSRRSHSRRSHSKHGMGLFGEIGKYGGARYGPIGSIVGNYVGERLDKRIGTGMRHKKRKHSRFGGALYPA
jgi:hypothetical protein